MQSNCVNGLEIELRIPRSREEIEAYMVANSKLIHSVLKPYKRGSEYEDLYQEATIGFYRGILNYVPGCGTQLSTYCYKCAQNAVKMYLRKNAAKSRTGDVRSLDEAFNMSNDPDGGPSGNGNVFSDEADQLHSPEPSVEEQTEQKEKFQLVMNYAKQCLTKKEYRAFIMAYEEYTQQEIANRMDVSQATVSQLIHKAHGKLKYCLQMNNY